MKATKSGPSKAIKNQINDYLAHKARVSMDRRPYISEPDQCGTYYAAKKNLERFIEFCGDMKTKEFRPVHFNNYAKWLKDQKALTSRKDEIERRGLSRTTITNYLRTVKTFFTWYQCHNNDINFNINALEINNPIYENKVSIALSDTELKEYFENARRSDVDLYQIASLHFLTLCRPQEIVDIVRHRHRENDYFQHDIEYENGSRVLIYKEGYAKTKIRAVTLSPTANQIYRNLAYPKWNARSSYYCKMKKADPRFKTAALRHTASTNLLKLLGYKDEITVDRARGIYMPTSTNKYVLPEVYKWDQVGNDIDCLKQYLLQD